MRPTTLTRALLFVLTLGSVSTLLASGRPSNKPCCCPPDVAGSPSCCCR